MMSISTHDVAALCPPGVTADVVAERCPWVLSYPERRPVALRHYERVARARDLATVMLLAPLWLPMLGLLAVCIKVSDPRAPVLFRQQRTGRHGHRFEVLKFRTMHPDAEEMKHRLRHLNELEWPDFKITNDPRITRMGRWLRSTGLDELPQLLNVVRGDMGLVGPRPTSFDASTYALWHTERLDARPGITGLWQTTGRADTVWDDRLRLECAYIRRRSMRLDTELLLRTIPTLVRMEGK